MKRYFIAVNHLEFGWLLETSEKNFCRIKEDIEKKYNVQKELDFEGLENYYSYDGKTLSFIGYIKEV